VGKLVSLVAKVTEDYRVDRDKKARPAVLVQQDPADLMVQQDPMGM
jgi:hypothetical protein